jgi:hypothetical protein
MNANRIPAVLSITVALVMALAELIIDAGQRFNIRRIIATGD